MQTSRTLQEQFEGFLNTPGLFQKSYKGMDFFDLDISPGENIELPEDFIIPTKLRLGQRVEFYMEHALNSTNNEILAKNLQIIDGKQTRGELDFIIYDRSRAQYIHLEMVYKFYFYDKTQEGPWPARWIGDNRRDSMFKKLNKLRDKQLPMLHEQATSSYLKKLGLEDIEIQQKVMAKGQLYLPYGEVYDNEFINPRAIAGYWVRLDKLATMASHILKIHLPYKNNWIVTPSEKHYEWNTLQAEWYTLKWRVSKNISSLIWIKTVEGSIKKVFLLPW